MNIVENQLLYCASGFIPKGNTFIFAHGYYQVTLVTYLYDMKYMFITCFTAF